MNKKRVNPTSYKFKNQKGQISVFVGLTFLILFTMFAMTINVGMVVHDKINLQNSVDFASIYVAQRQAEQLNAIAHMNYQIRQAHKLLSFRYVVLGTAGIHQEITSSGTIDNRESEYKWAKKENYPSCIASTILLQDITKDNWCKKDYYGAGFSGIPVMSNVNPFGGFNSSMQQTTIQLGSDLQRDATLAAVFNWWHVAFSLATFRMQVGYRKALIKTLARNLSKPINSNGMKDLYGESVFEGARKTFEYNLSESNRANMDNVNFQVMNSLEGITQEQWLPDIKTWTRLVYVDRRAESGNGAVSAADARLHYQMPQDYENNTGNKPYHDRFLDKADPDGFLRQMVTQDMPDGSDFEEILGFEKNPWYMVYNQVTGSVTSNALFNPMRGTPMQAQAFSKPFGGRIGPWYKKGWAQGSNMSTGMETVPVWSPRKLPGESAPSNPSDVKILPNAPKYPGDRLGWRSYLAVSSVGQITSVRPFIHENDYLNLLVDLYPTGNGNGLAGGQMREREMAAVAPDLFDIYYYSIDPNFHENYLQGKLDNWLINETQFTHIQYQNNRIWRDYGFKDAANLRNFTVKDQLTQSTRQQYGNQLFYALESNDDNGRANLLTSWVGGINVNEYRSPASGTVNSRFGKCQKFFQPGGKINVPGECLENGGRTGYSVKMVSKNYLTSSEHALGNSGATTGQILNPPQD